MEGTWGRRELEIGIVVNAFDSSSLILGRQMDLYEFEVDLV